MCKFNETEELINQFNQDYDNQEFEEDLEFVHFVPPFTTTEIWIGWILQHIGLPLKGISLILWKYGIFSNFWTGLIIISLALMCTMFVLSFLGFRIPDEEDLYFVQLEHEFTTTEIWIGYLLALSKIPQYGISLILWKYGIIANFWTGVIIIAHALMCTRIVLYFLGFRPYYVHYITIINQILNKTHN